eukprot:TRINITY_DN2088_c1_g1_i2.p1 TRINITY_DN2088_c1_g1~~TRINITY_DN2088_c1_g1_i2.p1  ORF type:complete len:131 (+),score=21.14 TRINITY_DN2088_c1_g1_i2:124-516(+)
MNAKVKSDGSGRDQYVIQAMRDFEANCRAPGCGYRAQFKNAELRNYEEQGRPWSAPTRRSRNVTFHTSIMSWEENSRTGAPQPPPDMPFEGRRLAALRRRQQAFCSRMSVPVDIQRERQRFSVTGFLRGH